MPEGGELLISCDSSKDFLVIEVKDNGIGLNEEQVELLRNNGVIETNQCAYSIVEGQKVAEEHGGSILVNSELGFGTSYTMILPKDYRAELTSPSMNFADQKSL
jgi:sensor histidine kinase regulating citrate/malate metabolism